jgi:hypothetical protein
MIRINSQQEAVPLNMLTKEMLEEQEKLWE